MTSRQVVSRQLIKVRGGLPVMVDTLKCCPTRLCLACCWEDKAPTRVRHAPDWRLAPVCGAGERRPTSERDYPSMVTCLRCIKLGIPPDAPSRLRGPR